MSDGSNWKDQYAAHIAAADMFKSKARLRDAIVRQCRATRDALGAYEARLLRDEYRTKERYERATAKEIKRLWLSANPINER